MHKKDKFGFWTFKSRFCLIGVPLSIHKKSQIESHYHKNKRIEIWMHHILIVCFLCTDVAHFNVVVFFVCTDRSCCRGGADERDLDLCILNNVFKTLNAYSNTSLKHSPCTEVARMADDKDRLVVSDETRRQHIKAFHHLHGLLQRIVKIVPMWVGGFRIECFIRFVIPRENEGI